MLHAVGRSSASLPLPTRLLGSFARVCTTNSAAATGWSAACTRPPKRGQVVLGDPDAPNVPRHYDRRAVPDVLLIGPPCSSALPAPSAAPAGAHRRGPAPPSPALPAPCPRGDPARPPGTTRQTAAAPEPPPELPPPTHTHKQGTVHAYVSGQEARGPGQP